MLDLIPKWLGEKCETEFQVKDVMADDIKGIFTEGEIDLWRMELLNAVGLPKLAKKACNRAKGKVQEDKRLWQEARAIFNEGKYLQSSKKFVSLSKYYTFHQDYKGSSDIWFDASDSFRAGGYFIRSFWCLFRGRWASSEYDKAKYFLKKSIIILNIYEGLSSNKLTGRLSFIARKWLKNNLHICLKSALLQGSLLDSQQVGLLANRADIPIKDLEFEEFYAPPEPKDGYEHLGYYIAQVMTFMDECRKIDYENLTQEARINQFEKIDKHIKNCELIEQRSSVWKFLAIKRKIFARLGTEDFTENGKLNCYFQDCEYSRLNRLQIMKKFR